MSIYKELSYENYIENVKSIRFCILGPIEIRRMSVAEINRTDTYQINEPVINGLFDPRMGVLDHNKLCHTCEQKNTFCPGHFGHINLAKPVFYIQFFDIVRKILKCVCFRCSKLLIDPESPQVKAILNKKYSRQKRWEMMYKLCSKVKRCGQETLDGCKAKQPDKIYREPIVKIVMEWKDLDTDKDDLKKQVLNAEEILRILQRISDDDAEALGFHRKYNRPEWMICTVLPVPPPAVRPSVRSDTGLRSEDDLTHKLCDIVKNNNTLKSKIEKGASKEQVDIATQVLQYHVATFIDNNIPGINPAQQRTGRLLKSLTERLKSKEGRIRGNLMGKRVDFSARSVITPDPNISIDELGVPIKIAMNLTFPEVVNKYNKEKLMKLVKNGPDVYPGAKCLRQGNRTFLLKNKDRTTIELSDGDIVERHMMNGDYVLFNRQPSLHRMSMMGHRVVVMPYNTFRSNPSVCPCFNSDYDGDEMNAHLPQSIVTMNELVELAAVPTQIISPRECKPIIAIVQDVPLGVYRLTKSHVTMNEKLFFNLASLNPRFIGQLPAPIASSPAHAPKYSGRSILSTVIPKNINITAPNKSWDKDNSTDGDKENFVVIENGVIKQGIIDKLIYQNRTRGLVHSIYNECGADETRMFFDNTQRIICDWLVNNGFSVGISDLIIDMNTQDNMKNIIHDMKVRVYDIITKMHVGKFENNSISNNNDYFESAVNKILNEASSKAGSQGMSKINDITNRMINMIKSGSKGNVINVAQMIACLGQVNVEGKRIAYGFDNRTLPHYTKYDDGPESRGFVESSFIKGLNPQEFFFHSMGGREGLIDTAVKSVAADTEIIILENNKPKCVKIGPWIDWHMEKNKKNVQFKEEKQTELLELDTMVYIPNMDSDGNMLWSHMKYVTRHDPDNVLYEVETESGRKVVVTQYDSMLVWDEEKEVFLSKPTTEIKIGEFVPITSKMPGPPVVLKEVDVSDYLPKNKFLYGTDFHIAKKMIIETMEGKEKIPTGWWEDHNGKEFTVPYTNKARLQRVLVRSDVGSIKEGCVHNFDAQRSNCSIPDKFPLDKDFGTFIGLYLAEGSCHVKSGKVCITNMDPNVLAFVRTWFNKYDIVHAEYSRNMELKNAEGKVVSKGFTCSIQGSSTMLAKFLDEFVGHGAQFKHVPSEAYAAPEEFIVGIINGYFAGDGSVSKNDISASSVSQDLIEGVYSLCARIGVFGKISKSQVKQNNIGTKNILPSYRLTIRACFAERMRKKVNFIIDYKNERLNNMKCANIHRNYSEVNDVVKDAVKSIKEVDIAKYPKVYDVTVPGTYNFTSRNGLNLRDTSETGYIQRKLVKAMEDCKISYDYTVRNASGTVIQFLYGEDGMDPIKVESQNVPYIELDYSQLRYKYLLTDNDDVDTYLDKNTAQIFKGSKDWEEKMQEHFDQIVSDRKFMIQDIFNSRLETTIMYPVSFQRIITNARAMFVKCAATDLNPMYVLSEINKLCADVYVSKVTKGNLFFQILARAYLSPKRVLMEYRFDKSTFDYVIQQIKLRFYDSIAHPSEMVGVISAQSIGEPATQMSSFKNTHIRIIGRDNYSFSGTIEDFTNKMFKRHASRVQPIGNDSYILDLEHEYSIIGVSNDEKTSWKRISQISKHPANGGLVKVKTRSGKTTTATLTHSFLGRTTNGIVEVKGSDLKVGDRIPVSKHIPEVENALVHKYIDGHGMEALDRDFGWLCGTYIADGNISGNGIKISKCIEEYYTKLEKIFSDKFNIPMTQRKTMRANFKDYPDRQYLGVENNFNNKPLAQFLGDNFGMGSANKMIPAWVFGANKQFIAGLIQGYFDGDGNICGDGKRGMIRAGSISEQLINDMIVLLAYFDIFASKCMETSNTGKDKKAFHTLQISRKYGPLFKECIGLEVKSKKEELDKLIDYVLRDDKKNDQEMIDKIPCLGEVIAETGKILELPGQSRLYGRWAKKDSIGRNTLTKYIEVFDEANKTKKSAKAGANLELLKQAACSDVIWDEIISLEYLDDPKEYVYDFTVPGNDSFMVDTCILVHNTLNTFHLSGVSSASKAVRGVPRMKELLSVTKNIKAPAMTVYIDKNIRRNKTDAKKVLNTVQTTFFRDIVKHSKIYFDPETFETTVDDDQLFLETYREFVKEELAKVSKLTPWLLRLEFDKEKMKEYDIMMMDLGNIMYDFYKDSVNCMFSDDSADKLVMRVKLPESNDEDKDIITELKALEKNIMDNIIITGMHKVNKVVMNNQEYQVYNEELGTFEKTNEWVLETNGTNLIEIMGHKNVDATRTICNDVNEIYELLGVEAARQALYNEMSDIIKDADLYVNYRHISLLVDTMTNKGYLLSIDRHGINRVDIGPLAKCSFEEVTDMLVKAGIFSEVDKITGVSANVMLGQIPPYGTGETEVMIDEKKLMELAKALNIEDDEDNTDSYIESVNQNTIDQVCDVDNIGFDFTLPAISAMEKLNIPSIVA